jgi:hypothetical protein
VEQEINSALAGSFTAFDEEELESELQELEELEAVNTSAFANLGNSSLCTQVSARTAAQKVPSAVDLPQAPDGPIHILPEVPVHPVILPDAAYEGKRAERVLA